MRGTHGFNRLILATLLASLAVVSAAQVSTAGRWQASMAENGVRYLSFSAASPQLGKTVEHTVTFRYDPKDTKYSKSSIGFAVLVEDVTALKSFPFDAFEGPDASTHGKKLLRLTVNRPGQPPFAVDSFVNGATPDTNKFEFGTSALSQDPKSTEKGVLKALATDADSLQITLTHPRNPKVKLEFLVPVSNQRNEFKALLSGLK